jgi:hypothetical protein
MLVIAGGNNMPQMSYQLPEGVVYAKPGEFLICSNAKSGYKVYKVHDLYLITRLIPVEPVLAGGKPLGFVSRSSVAASSEPEIHYLITEFEKTFPSEKNAIESISHHTLGPTLPDRYLDVRKFTSTSCKVHPG